MARRTATAALALALVLAGCAETGETQRASTPEGPAVPNENPDGDVRPADPAAGAASTTGREAVSGRIQSIGGQDGGTITLVEPIRGVSTIVMGPDTVLRDGRRNPVTRDQLQKDTLVQASGERQGAVMSADEVVVQQQP